MTAAFLFLILALACFIAGAIGVGAGAIGVGSGRVSLTDLGLAFVVGAILTSPGVL